jgi:hypothetical protein
MTYMDHPLGRRPFFGQLCNTAREENIYTLYFAATWLSRMCIKTLYHCDHFSQKKAHKNYWIFKNNVHEFITFKVGNAFLLKFVAFQSFLCYLFINFM